MAGGRRQARKRSPRFWFLGRSCHCRLGHGTGFKGPRVTATRSHPTPFRKWSHGQPAHKLPDMATRTLRRRGEESVHRRGDMGSVSFPQSSSSSPPLLLLFSSSSPPPFVLLLLSSSSPPSPLLLLLACFHSVPRTCLQRLDFLQPQVQQNAEMLSIKRINARCNRVCGTVVRHRHRPVDGKSPHQHRAFFARLHV